MSMKPILFSTDMVQAILDGRKTATRRLVKPRYVLDADNNPHFFSRAEGNLFVWEDRPYIKTAIKQPYLPGDVLYVRETWRVLEASSPPRRCVIEYKAGGTQEFDDVIALPTADSKWRPSIHMPKEAARIFLRVTDVRAERLWQMRNDDALREGVPTEWPMNPVYCPQCNGTGLVGTYDSDTLGFKEIDCPFCKEPISRFRELWNHLRKGNDYHSTRFESGPFVWVVEFERIKKPEVAK